MFKNCYSCKWKKDLNEEDFICLNEEFCEEWDKWEEAIKPEEDLNGNEDRLDR